LALLIVGTHHHEGKQMCNAIRLRFFARIRIDITRIDRSRVRVLFAQMVECFVFSKMNARVFLFLLKVVLRRKFYKKEEDFARICALLSLSRRQVRERTALERKKTDVNAFGSCDDVVL